MKKESRKQPIKPLKSEKGPGKIRNSSFADGIPNGLDEVNEMKEEFGKKEGQKFGGKNTSTIFAVRSKKLQVLQNSIGCFLGKKLIEKQQKVFVDLIKALTFALRLKKWGLTGVGRSLKVWKQQHVNQVFTVRLRKQIHSIEDCQISREKR